MSKVNYAQQMYYTGAGYLDAKMQPVATLEDLQKITRSHRFIGLTVTVLNDGTGQGPRDYWIKENVAKWVLKEMPSDIDIVGSDVEKIEKTENI